MYTTLPTHIQTRFAADKVAVLTRQAAEIDEDSSPEDIAKAAIYSTDSMQQFFIRNFRPNIQRQQMFRQLHAIRMRYNENPHEVLDRVVAAINYTKRTIELLNATTRGISIPKLTKVKLPEYYKRFL